MPIKSRENIIGAWAFLTGLVLAVVTGITVGLIPNLNINPLVLGILALLGILMGFVVAEKDVQTFLLASASLVLVSYAGISGLVLGAAINGVNIGSIIGNILQALLAMFVPSTIVVALKTVFSIAKS
jgi:hypothetical protein